MGSGETLTATETGWGLWGAGASMALRGAIPAGDIGGWPGRVHAVLTGGVDGGERAGGPAKC